MSRSYKAPVWTEGYKGIWRRYAKRMANKAVRRNNAIKDGGAYKREMNSWDICDWKFWDEKNPKTRRK